MMTQHSQIYGRVWKYGDGVNTDVIFPGKYTYTVTEPAEMARHALEDLDPTFAGQVQPGDVIVAGKNWGNGSSREQAVSCLKAAGIGAVIAVSFARIWYRNAINNGLLALTCPEAVAALEHGERVTVDLEQGLIRGEQGSFAFPPFAASVQAILADGGLIPHLKKQFDSSEQKQPVKERAD
jgi:3-isopropylmalate/(R)-2-methylmalate dehydratase small subunit